MKTKDPYAAWKFKHLFLTSLSRILVLLVIPYFLMTLFGAPITLSSTVVGQISLLFLLYVIALFCMKWGYADQFKGIREIEFMQGFRQFLLHDLLLNLGAGLFLGVLILLIL